MTSNLADTLPEKCFISHSYADDAELQQLLDWLPSSVSPCIFPPIPRDPGSMVTSELIQTILGCDGVIYVKGAHAKSSFWVRFERDYALQTGKSVFVFDSEAATISQDTSEPLRPPVYPMYHSRDGDVVVGVLSFMREERSFDLFLKSEDMEPGRLFQEQTTGEREDKLDKGGLVVLFLSGTTPSEFIESALKEASAACEAGRVLVALIDREARNTFRSLPASLQKRAWVELYREEPKAPDPEPSPQEPADAKPKGWWRRLLGTQKEPRPSREWQSELDHSRLDDLIISLYGLVDRGDTST
jgi:hypothetical protein